MTDKFSMAIKKQVLLLSFESLFLLFEQSITNSEYDYSIHPILGGILILIKKIFQRICAHKGTLMGLILAGIKFGQFREFWRYSPNLVPAKIKKNDHSPN